MTHSKSYPVTTEASLPQPHVQYDSKPKRMCCSGWLPWITAGALAWSLLICIYVLGGPKLFPKTIDPYDELIPTVKKGYLQVYPFRWFVNNGIESRYSTHLPPRNLSATTAALSDLLRGYPTTHGNVYKNCWLENPSTSNPCFYDSSWLADVCTPGYSYGYQEKSGYFNPCFIVKFDETEDWTPLTTKHVPSHIADHFDHGFMPVHCFTKDTSTSLKITVYPPKGFSLLFFPVSKFNSSKKYLAPLVAVKVDGIQKGQNVTVECSVITPNAFMLWNNGKAVIHFTSGGLS